MNMEIEEKKNELNIAIRELLMLIDFIDGTQEKYTDYIPNSLNDLDYLNQQLALVKKAKDKLVAIFKD